MPEWTWQGILTSIVATVLWAVGATMLTWIKHKWPKYGDLALYWVASAACLAVIVFATTGYRPFAKPRLQVTPENIESNVKLWSEDLGLAFTKGNIPDTYFALSLTTRTGTPIQVTRATKEKPSYLQFVTTLAFSPEHQAVMGTLTKDQIDTVMQEIALELAKTRVGSAIATMNMPQTGTNVVGQTMVVLQKAAPIAELNEARFSDYIDDMEFTASLTRSATSLALRRATIARTITRGIGTH